MFLIPLPPASVASQTRKPIESSSKKSKAANNSEQTHKSKTLSTGSRSVLKSSAQKTSVVSNSHSFPVEHLPVPPPPAFPHVTKFLAAAQLPVTDVTNDEQVLTDNVIIDSAPEANSTLVIDEPEVPMPITPISHLSTSLPLATTPLTSIPSCSSRHGTTGNSSGNPAASIMVETVSNRRIFHQADGSSSGELYILLLK